MERSSVSRELLALLNRILCIAEQILSWNFIYSNHILFCYHKLIFIKSEVSIEFLNKCCSLANISLPRKVVGVFEADQSPFLRPGPTWRDTILDENVIELFFKVLTYILVCYGARRLLFALKSD